MTGATSEPPAPGTRTAVPVRLEAGHDPLFAGAAVLLDEYRQYYGANPAPDAAATWLLEQVLSERTRVYTVGQGVTAHGICTVAVVPAALTLRTVWLVRDLFVVPEARRQGVARALLAQVAHEARAGGAHRVSLQTETANTRAIELYARNGFEVLTDVAVMDRLLEP